MAKVILRQKAIDDLNDIRDYTFKQWTKECKDDIITLTKKE